MNNVILNVKGGSGSGKTTCFRKFLDLPTTEIWGENLHTKSDKLEIKGYEIDARSLGLENKLFLMGSYEATCGGTDKVKTQQEIADRAVEWYNKGFHVLFEGLLVSKLGPAGTVTKALVETAGDRAWWLFLDTPVELCLERVLNRRQERGDFREFDPHKSFYRDHKYSKKCKTNLENADINSTGWVRHDNAYNEVVAMLMWSEKHYGSS